MRSLPILPDAGWIWWFSALLFVQTLRYLNFLQDFSLSRYILPVVLDKIWRAELLECFAPVLTKGAEHKWEPGSSSFSFSYQAFLSWKAHSSSHIWVSVICRFWSLELKCCANLPAQSQWLPMSAAGPHSSHWQTCRTMYFLVYTRLTDMNFLTVLLNLWASIGIFLYILLYREKPHN